jgi:hypothetical protein
MDSQAYVFGTQRDSGFGRVVVPGQAGALEIWEKICLGDRTDVKCFQNVIIHFWEFGDTWTIFKSWPR